MVRKILLIASAVTTLCLCLTAAARTNYGPQLLYSITYYSDATMTQEVGFQRVGCGPGIDSMEGIRTQFRGPRVIEDLCPPKFPNPTH